MTNAEVGGAVHRDGERRLDHGTTIEISLGGVGSIRVVEGVGVLECAPGTSSALERELREGPVRGIEHWAGGGAVLHASCLRVGRAAVAFMGTSGMGKSTMVAALVDASTQLVSDGMTLVDVETARVIEGLKRCKLTDESIARLRISGPGDYTNERSRKRYVQLHDQRPLGDARLSVAYALSDADHEGIEDLPPLEQVRALVANTYLLQHLPLSQCGRLLLDAAALINAGVRVKALRRRRDWQHFEGLLDLVRRDLAALFPSSGQP